MTGILQSMRQLRSHWQRPRIPEGHRVYAIGDIHGRADLLEDILGQIDLDRETHDPERTTLIFLGDYIDRGLASREVLKILSSRARRAINRVFLKGNHEAAALAFLDDPLSARAWLGYGGDATLYSYGVRMTTTMPSDQELLEIRNELRQAMPDDHLKFLQNLQLSFRIGGYLFVHAGIRPGVPLALQSEQDLLEIREEFTLSSADHGARIVHGHSIAYQMEVLPNRIGVDTGAYATGCLTALVLSDETWSSLATAQHGPATSRD